MFGSWWVVWMLFMFLLLVPPLGYGWGYRRWGPPYPTYIQRRRARGAASDGAAAFDHSAWGWGGDFVWVVLVIGVAWAFGGLFWR
jgi:hypothetical protein